MTLRHASKALFILLLSAVGASAAAPSSRLAGELEKYVAPASRPDAPAGFSYMPDGINIATLSPDCRKISLSSIADGKDAGTLFDVANTREAQIVAIEGFRLSPDASKILVWTDAKPLYRRSSTAKYYVYEVRSRILRPLSKETERQREPVFSPNSRMVAFVDPATNNIRIAKLDYGSEVAVTTDGAPNEIINGVPDWTYEEEFATTCSMAWAPDNLTLSYLRYDERDVPAYSLALYEGACDPRPQYALYPGTFTYKYPVAGQKNSSVSLHSYDIETRKIKDIDLPAASVEYIPRLAYGPDAATLIVATLNRDQTRLEIFRANPKSAVIKSLYVDDARAWIPEEAYADLTCDADGFTVGTLASGFFSYRTISYQGTPLAETCIPDADATAYYGKDAAGTRYFQAAAPTPLDRTVYSIDAKGRRRAISPEKGSSAAEFAPSMAFAVLSRSDIDTPPVYTLCKTAGAELKTIRTLEDNAAYRSRIGSLGVVKEFFTIPAAGTTPALNAYIVKPADFSASRSYPVIISQYSGPGSQSVLNRWSLDWEQYFAANGFIVVCVDPRGTGGRGAQFMQCVYKQLGALETVDLTAAARYIASQSWADASRIGLYGWSYGGYEALMCATQGASATPFAAAVAIAPVTSWRLYDTVYAERFMLTPGQNPDGYDASAPLLRADKLGSPLLIMYGTSDDNVHPANSLEFVARLQQSGLMCDMFVFPDMNHSINGCRTRALVWARMFDFFSRNLK